MRTRIGVAMALMAALAELAIPTSGAAKTFDWAPDILDVPSMGSAVEDAARIARVHITAREPVLEAGAESPRCGYLYSATVVESLKGGTNPFQFFAAVDADFAGFDRDYFVIVYQYESPARQVLIDRLSMTMTRDQFLRISCQNFEELFVATYYQTMRAFEPQRGGNPERLVPTNRPDVLSCLRPAIEDGLHFLTTVPIQDWQTLKRTVPEALAAPRELVMC